MRGLIVLIFFGGVALAQDKENYGLPPELLLLARVKVHAVETLERQPNYTCLETIERSDRLLPAKRYKLVDTLRLEVALLDGHEMFAWPGAKKFDTRDLTDMVTHGAIGNGNFAIFAKAVFQTSAPTFTYRGETSLEGRAAVKWDFRVPLMNSGYHLRIGRQEGIAGYHGSFWADPASLDLIRLEIAAEDIPSNLDLSSTFDRMDYTRRKIGDSEFLLPLSSDLTLIDLRGNEHRNRIRFSDCRQYLGESVLRFDDAPVDKEGPKTLPTIELPANLEILTTVEHGIDLRRSVVGDPIRATVLENAKIKGQTVIPKGAMIAGRIAGLDRTGGGYSLSLQFADVEWPEARAVFTGVFDATALPPGLTRAPVRISHIESPKFRLGGVRIVLRNSAKLPAGLTMYWRTENTEPLKAADRK